MTLNLGLNEASQKLSSNRSLNFIRYAAGCMTTMETGTTPEFPIIRLPIQGL